MATDHSQISASYVLSVTVPYLAEVLYLPFIFVVSVKTLYWDRKRRIMSSVEPECR
jgi:hypothetical protein